MRISLVEWAAKRIYEDINRDTVIRAFGGALQELLGSAASPPVLESREVREGGDQMLFATELASETFRLQAGTAGFRFSIDPITSSRGVTGETHRWLAFDLPGEATLEGEACLSGSRPGYAGLSGEGIEEGTRRRMAKAFEAPFGTAARPSEEEQLSLALENLKYHASGGYLPGSRVLAILEQLCSRRGESDPRGALGRLWLGWHALGAQEYDRALALLGPLAAQGEGLEVAVEADLELPPYPNEDLRVAPCSYKTPQRPIFYALVGLGLAHQGRDERALMREALAKALALFSPPYEGYDCEAERRARELERNDR